MADIIQARRSDDKQYVHVVFEVSRTINLSDIQRARERANTVATATNGDAIAAVIGATIQQTRLAQANRMDVQALIAALLEHLMDKPLCSAQRGRINVLADLGHTPATIRTADGDR